MKIDHAKYAALPYASYLITKTYKVLKYLRNYLVYRPIKASR